ncbi:MAG: tripartite tricarboxylate transporter substrate binding protein [Betaproteobacteria bacterium]|jgi:tripartite-type tricarboxylate transporter receptor subunit TctC
MNQYTKHFLAAWICTLGTFSFSLFAQNSTYPNKPIRFVVPFAPGGSTDVTARIIGQKISEILKQQVFVENRAGAGASIGIQNAATSAPDGYTILVVSPSIIVNATSMGASAGYKPQDFEVVSFASNLPMGIFVNEKIQANNLEELHQIALKEHLSFATAGNGTPPSMTCENLFRIIWKSDVTHIPYKGSSPALLATVSGETPITCGAMTGVTPFAKQGKVKVLAVSSEKRLASLPNVPTVIEAGYPQLRDDLWTGVFVPKNTPLEIKQKINQAINLALQSPEVIEKLDINDLVPMGGNLQQNTEYFNSEIVRWNKTISLIKSK